MNQESKNARAKAFDLLKLKPAIILLPILLAGIFIILTQAQTSGLHSPESDDYAYRLERSVVPAVYPLKAARVTKETFGSVRGEDRYDLISIDGAGSQGHLESSPELTVESWQFLLGQLKPDGILSYTLREPDISETTIYRLIALGYGALSRSGVKEPRNNLILVKNQHVAIIVAGRKAFSDEFMMTTEMLNVERGFQVVISPLVEESLGISWLISRLTHTSIVSDYAENITAPDNNRPFFFWTHRFPSFSTAAALLALMTSAIFLYRRLRHQPLRVVESYDYIIYHLTVLATLNVTLLLRLQSYIPASGPALALGVFGIQFGVTAICLLIGVKSAFRGSRSFFTIGSICGFLMICMIATGILPLLMETSDLPVPAKMAIVIGTLLVLAVSTTWPVLGIGPTSIKISARLIARMVLLLTCTMTANFFITRFIGISAGVWAMAVIMLMLVRTTRIIPSITKQPAAAVSPVDARLVVEKFNESVPVTEPLDLLSASAGFSVFEISERELSS